MTRWSGCLRGFMFAATLFAAVFSADSASAWCWRGGYGFGWRPFCGPRYSYSYAASSYGFGCFAPRFYSYSCYSPFVYRCYPYSYNLGCYPYWNGWGWNGWGWNGWGWGCGPFASNAVCLPSAYAPVYGPAGVFPYLGLASNDAAVNGAAVNGAAVNGAAVNTVAVNNAAVNDVVAKRALARFPTPAIARASTPTIVRASNTDARMRAGRLVAIGDGHMQSAVADRAALSKALDAYKRAASVAADQPDTFLRQAIVLVAMEKQEAADAAIARAVSIDARLGDDPSAAREAARRLPPDPVFGDRPAGGPTTLASRTAGLLERIFRDTDGSSQAARESGANWIAKRWTERFGSGTTRLASK